VESDRLTILLNLSRQSISARESAHRAIANDIYLSLFSYPDGGQSKEKTATSVSK
jgi:hypothetical protein